MHNKHDKHNEINEHAEHNGHSEHTVPTSRRAFLAQTGTAIAAASLAPSAVALQRTIRPRRSILILGGTGFLGPHIVWDALERGYDVTLFNRGRTDPGLFPDIETLIGDRYGDLASLQAQVEAGRTWDAVIDTFTYVPGVVAAAARVLQPAVGRYVVVSTTSVYADNNTPHMDESGPLETISDEIAAGITSHRQVGQYYGAMKARCESAAEEILPGKVISPRPGLICGPRDTTGRFSYWPVRASEGGSMIAPGTPTDPIQIIDVRDLARFINRLIEDNASGPFNAFTPAGRESIGSVVRGSIAAAGAGTAAEWIPADFLASQGVQPWQHMPAWLPPTTPGYAGFGRLSSARSEKAGLSCRPIEATARAILEYYASRPAELEGRDGFDVDAWRTRVRGGLPAAEEARVLAAWRDDNADRGDKADR